MPAVKLGMSFAAHAVVTLQLSSFALYVLLLQPLKPLIDAGSNMQLIDVPISNCIKSGVNKM